jgi:hypothetical protein
MGFSPGGKGLIVWLGSIRGRKFSSIMAEFELCVKNAINTGYSGFLIKKERATPLAGRLGSPREKEVRTALADGCCNPLKLPRRGDYIFQLNS